MEIYKKRKVLKTMNKTNHRHNGFTLLELMAATVIGAFILLVTVGAFRTVTAAREIVNSNINIGDELRFAANMIRRDFLNIYRDSKDELMKFVGTTEEVNGVMVTSLTLRVVSAGKARSDQPESGVYEVQYYLSDDGEQTKFMRRMCPVVGHVDIDGEVESAGGMLTVIAGAVSGFTMRYFDGSEWVDDWGEEMTEIPELVEVALAGQDKEQRQDAIVRSFIASFPRLRAEEESEDEETEQQSLDTINEEMNG